MFTVSSAAANTALTTLDAVKDELNITTTDEDAYLETQISRVSSLICSYLNISAASDGTREIGRETLIETFRLARCQPKLLLARYPVTSITSVVEDGETLTAAEYEFDGATGTLRRLTTDDEPSTWDAAKIVVTYVAGWLLPDDGTTRNLPYDIEDAAIGLIKATRSARTRDPLVKSEDVPGVLSTSYWVGGVGEGGAIPPDVMSKLDPYRNISV